MGSRRATLGLALAVLAAVLPPREAAAQRTVIPGARVVRVDDGDTIDVRIGDRVERVRYIGIDAPEVGHRARGGRAAREGASGGAAAAHANGSLVSGRVVALELDAERRDRYGRLLAYVWVGATMINAELVARGYARAMPIPPNLRHAGWLAALESGARDASRGLWARGAGAFDRLADGPVSVSRTRTSRPPWRSRESPRR